MSARLFLGEFNEKLVVVVELHRINGCEAAKESFYRDLKEYTICHIHSFLRAFSSISELTGNQILADGLKKSLLSLSRSDCDSRDKLLSLFNSGDKLMTLESDRIPPEEMIILTLLGGTNVFFSMLFRPETLSAGLFSLIVSSAMIYLLLIIYERDRYAQVRHDHGLVCDYVLEYLKKHIGVDCSSSKEIDMLAKIKVVIKNCEDSLLGRARSYWVFGVFVFLFSGFGYGMVYESLNDYPRMQDSPLGSSYNGNLPVIGIVSPNWPSASLKSYIMAGIIDNYTELSAEIEPPIATQKTFLSMGNGEGSISIHPEIWVENNEELIRRYVRAFGSVSLGQGYAVGQQGLCYTAVGGMAGVDVDISDLKSSRVSQEFDMNGDGRGDIWIGSKGWTSVEIEKKRLQSYELDKYYEFHVFDRDVHNKLVDRNSANGMPSMFFCYYPDSLFTDSNVRLVEEGEHDEILWKDILNSQSGEVEMGGTSWPNLKLRVAYRSDLVMVSRELEMLLKNFMIRNEDVVNMLGEIESGESVESVASEWINSNEELILSWLTGFQLSRP